MTKDTISPGPGTYKEQDSCLVNQPALQMASYRSQTIRDFEVHVTGKDNPGVGNYNLP